MRALGLVLTVALLLLQHRLWLSEDGWREVQGLKQRLAATRAENARLEARNLHLLAQLGFPAPGQDGSTPAAPARLAGNTRSSEAPQR